MTTAELFQRARDATHTTYATLAAMLNVNPQRLNDWKSGYRHCPIRVQAQLCELAGMSAAEARDFIWTEACRARNPVDLATE